MSETLAVTFTVEQIRITVDQLLVSWEWLLEATEPGRGTPAPAPALTDAQAERLEALGHSDRAYRAWNLRHGMSALPPSAAAVRIGAVDAQAAVAAAVTEAVHLVAEEARACYVGGLHRQADTVRAALGWLAGTAALFVDPLGELRNETTAAAVDRLLQRADRAARAATRTLDEEPEPVIDPDTGRPARCPACGRRSLQREGTGIWCVSATCVCTGEAAPDRAECGCRQQEKRAGRRHAWPVGEEDRLWDAIDAAEAPQPQPVIRRGAVGHGGWQSRGMAGQQ